MTKICSVFVAVMFATSSFAQTATQDDRQFALDRILVVTESGTNLPPNLGLAFSKIELLNPTKIIADAKDIYLVYLEKSGKEEVRKSIEILKSSSAILVAEPDYYFSPDYYASENYGSSNHNFSDKNGVIPNDSMFSDQWALQAINAPQAWTITTGSKDVIVGIMDSGLDFDHPDLKDNLWINPNPNQTIGEHTFENDFHGYNFVTMTATPPSSGSHGTHVAGIVGAKGNNGIGIVGACWEVSLAMLSIQSNISAAIKALEYANFHNIRIVNNSWGHYTYPPSEPLYEAIRTYNGLFVVSAGNSRQGNMDHDTVEMHYPTGFGVDNLYGPGLPHIISVTSSRRNDSVSNVNWGTTSVHIAAPGSGILSTYPMNREDRNGYHTMSGTSMAAPYVAGVAALIMSVRPDLKPEQIKDILVATARKVPTFEDRCIAGGILDANAAVKAALTWGK
jgi:subtilisin family serine protease